MTSIIDEYLYQWSKYCQKWRTGTKNDHLGAILETESFLNAKPNNLGLFLQQGSVLLMKLEVERMVNIKDDPYCTSFLRTPYHPSSSILSNPPPLPNHFSFYNSYESNFNGYLPLQQQKEQEQQQEMILKDPCFAAHEQMHYWITLLHLLLVVQSKALSFYFQIYNNKNKNFVQNYQDRNTNLDQFDHPGVEEIVHVITRLYNMVRNQNQKKIKGTINLTLQAMLECLDNYFSQFNINDNYNNNNNINNKSGLFEPFECICDYPHFLSSNEELSHATASLSSLATLSILPVNLQCNSGSVINHFDYKNIDNIISEKEFLEQKQREYQQEQDRFQSWNNEFFSPTGSLSLFNDNSSNESDSASNSDEENEYDIKINNIIYGINNEIQLLAPPPLQPLLQQNQQEKKQVVSFNKIIAPPQSLEQKQYEYYHQQQPCNHQQNLCRSLSQPPLIRLLPSSTKFSTERSITSQELNSSSSSSSSSFSNDNINMNININKNAQNQKSSSKILCTNAMDECINRKTEICPYHHKLLPYDQGLDELINVEQFIDNTNNTINNNNDNIVSLNSSHSSSSSSSISLSYFSSMQLKSYCTDIFLPYKVPFSKSYIINLFNDRKAYYLVPEESRKQLRKVVRVANEMKWIVCVQLPTNQCKSSIGKLKSILKKQKIEYYLPSVNFLIRYAPESTSISKQKYINMYLFLRTNQEFCNLCSNVNASYF